ncbi:hypothetical protein [Nocardia sp. NPDC059228]|uniref:hypothetical protein n=1 Tax=Nocardia sp. NPDC059228 TaxID=3346777 RepID=UPI0036BF794D
MVDEGVYRVRFCESCTATTEEATKFHDLLRALGGMVVYGTYPGPLVIGIAVEAAEHVASFPFVESVVSVSDNSAVSGQPTPH